MLVFGQKKQGFLGGFFFGLLLASSFSFPEIAFADGHSHAERFVVRRTGFLYELVADFIIRSVCLDELL